MSNDPCARFALSFLNTHGRLPDSSSESRTERLAGRWLDLMRRQARSGELNGPDLAAMESLFPGWLTSSHESTWIIKARQLADFVMVNRRTPDPQTSAPESHQHQLFLWMSAHRALSSSGRLAPQRAQWLHEHVPGWDGAWDDVPAPMR